MAHTARPNNLYSNPQVDDLLDKGRASSDQAQRKDLYQQAQKIAVDDAPLVYYQFPLAIMLARPNVQGMVVYPDQIMRFEVGVAQIMGSSGLEFEVRGLV